MPTNHDALESGPTGVFDAQTWQMLPDLLGHLPEPVALHLWADPQASPAEAEAARLVQTLSGRFPGLSSQIFPRRANYPYYPVIGVMGLAAGEVVDHGLRLIGLPAGYQLTSLIAAIQCVAFKGMTSEARTRIQLHRLAADVALELITSAEDEAGTVMAQAVFNMAVASHRLRSFLIMAGSFPEILLRYSVQTVPHLVINGREHLSGPADETAILACISRTMR